MSKMINCILVLDESVKRELSYDPTELTIYGVIIINNITELTQEYLDKTSKVIFLGTFNYAQLGRLTLYKEVCNLEYYLLTKDTVLASLMNGFCKCYILEYSAVDSNLISAVLYNDATSLEMYTPADLRQVDLENAETILNETTNSYVRKLAEDFIRLHSLAVNSHKQLEDSHIAQRELSSKILTLEHDISVRDEAYREQLKKDLQLASILKDYQVILTKDIYNKVNILEYKDRPKIIYIKEYEDFIHLESFLNTLFGMIQVQLKKSCKIIRLLDSCDLLKIKKLSQTYVQLGSRFLESEVIANDRLLSVGSYIKVIDFLMENKSTLDILIVVDSKKYQDIVLSGTGMLQYGLCRTHKTAFQLGISSSQNIIYNEVYSPNNPMTWEHYDDYATAESPEDRFQFLASRPVIQIIYQTINNLL